MCIFRCSAFLTQELSLPAGPWSKPLTDGALTPVGSQERGRTMSDNRTHPLDDNQNEDDGNRSKTSYGEHLSKVTQHKSYIISKDSQAFDAFGWTLDQIKEHQRLVELNRYEAENSYNLACTQLNTLIAVSGIALSIVVSCLFTIYDSSNVVIITSCCFIASSLIISVHASLRSRYIIASYPSGWVPFVSAEDLEQQIIAAINATLVIEASHLKEIDKKRSALNYAMVLFIIGICLLVSGSIVQVFAI